MVNNEMQSLNEVDAEGRLDVVLYKLAERACRGIEERHNLNGLWDELKEEVEDGIREYVPEDKYIEVPSILKVLFRGMKKVQNA